MSLVDASTILVPERLLQSIEKSIDFLSKKIRREDGADSSLRKDYASILKQYNGLLQTCIENANQAGAVFDDDAYYQPKPEDAPVSVDDD